MQFIPLMGDYKQQATAKDYGQFLIDIFDEWYANDVGKIGIQFIEQWFMAYLVYNQVYVFFVKPAAINWLLNKMAIFIVAIIMFILNINSEILLKPL